MVSYQRDEYRQSQPSIQRYLFLSGSGRRNAQLEGVCIEMCPCHAADVLGVSVSRQISTHSCIKTKSACLS